MGTQLTSPKKGAEPLPEFSAHFYCGQTDGCIKMPLGMEVGLKEHKVEHKVAWAKGTQLPPEKRAHPPHPIFDPCLLWPYGWMDEDAAWYGSRHRPRPHCIRRGLSYPRKGHSSPLFSAHVYCGHGHLSKLLRSSCYVLK